MTEIEIKTEGYSVLFHLNRDGRPDSIDIEPTLQPEDLKFDCDVVVKQGMNMGALVLHYWEDCVIEQVYLWDAFNNAKNGGEKT